MPFESTLDTRIQLRTLQFARNALAVAHEELLTLENNPFVAGRNYRRKRVRLRRRIDILVTLIARFEAELAAYTPAPSPQAATHESDRTGGKELRQSMPDL